MLGGELWSMSPLVHPELVTGCLRASLPMKLCGSQGGLFLTLPSVSRLLHLGNALQSSWLSDSAHTGGGSHHFCDIKGHRGQVFFCFFWTGVFLHFVHLHVVFILGQLQVGVVGRRSELVARHDEKDESGHFHQELWTQTGGESRRLVKGGRKDVKIDEGR